jgi:hypothetical protein
MLAMVIGAVLLIPIIGLQADVVPVELPANLVMVGQFDRLDELQPWDSVTLISEDGSEQPYVVAWSRLYPADTLPPEVYDGPASGGTALTLITDAPLEEDLYPTQRVVRAVPLP